jgi:Kef-type K+ transport system membrane component KefB
VLAVFLLAEQSDDGMTLAGEQSAQALAVRVWSRIRTIPTQPGCRASEGHDICLVFWLIPRLCGSAERLPVSHGLIGFAFITMLLYAWAAEVLGGMPAIIGAFMAGLFLARSPLKKRIESGFLPLVYGVFVPIFFVNIGLSADVRLLVTGSLGLLVGMCAVIILSKLLAAGLAGLLGGLTGLETLQLGVGMLPRGEMTLIIATVGITENLIGVEVFSVAVGIVVVTVVLTPLLLRYAFARAPAPDLTMLESS